MGHDQMANPLLGAAMIRAGAKIGRPTGAVRPPLSRAAGARVTGRPQIARLLDTARCHPAGLVGRTAAGGAAAGVGATGREVVDVGP